MAGRLLTARVLVIMQLMRATLAFFTVPSGLGVPREGLSPGAFLEKPSGRLRKFNSQAETIQKKLDSLELQCKATFNKDKATLEGLERELRLVSGKLAANVALQSGAKAAADQDQAQSVKLGDMRDTTSAMCKTQKKSLNASLEMMLADQKNSKALRGLSSQCGYAALTATDAPKVLQPLTPSASVVLLQHCSDDVAAEVLAAGEALQRQASKFTTVFAKQAFDDAVRGSSTDSVLPSLLVSSKAWPSKGKPPSKSKQKSANACKMSKDSVNCNKLNSALETIALRMEEQKNAAVTNMRKQVDECTEKERAINDRLKANDAQYGRSSAALVRFTGIQAGLAASRAAVVQRLERHQRDAAKFKSTCKNTQRDYEGELEDVLKKRQRQANRNAGRKVAIQDCKVTDWIFSQCSKPCKKEEEDDAGTMNATRSVAQNAGNSPEGASCPPLSAKLKCNDKPCPVDCAFTEWEKWSSCSKACGGGTTIRSRKVTMNAKDGGKVCPGIEERKSCNVGSCSDVCKLKPWTPWSACSRRCKFSKNSAAGRQRRERAIQGNPVARGGVNPCPPANDKTRFMDRTCNKEICPQGITCDASQDILFLLDGSGAAGRDFQDQLDLVDAVVKASSEKVQFGVLSYGKEVQILSRITSNRQDIAAASVYKPPKGGSRMCAKGVTIGSTLFSDPGVGGGRPRIAVLLLGGAPATFVDAKKAADELRATGVRLVVGLVDDGSKFARDQACSLASAPCSANIEAVASWSQMAAEPGRFLAGICRNLVYPTKKAAPAAKALAKTVDEDKKKKKKMPDWVKRQVDEDEDDE